jgi:[ribosomal protein S5]-alanine N-acetyltransferase
MFAFRGAPPDLMATIVGTERLSLEPIREDHAPDIFREFSAEVATYMLPKPAAHAEETLNFVRGSRARMASGQNPQLVILSRSSGEFLGCCGLHPSDHPSEGAPSLGIWLKRGAHGRRYGREAIAGLIRWAAENLAAEHLLYPVDERNIPSRRIPESLGGTLVGKRQEVGATGNTLRLLVYQISLRKMRGQTL